MPAAPRALFTRGVAGRSWTRGLTRGPHMRKSMGPLKAEDDASGTSRPGSQDGLLAPAKNLEIGIKQRLVACVQYGVISVSLTLFNRAVFSIYRFNFPGLFTMLQMVLTVFYLGIFHLCGYVQLGRITRASAIKVRSLPGAARAQVAQVFSSSRASLGPVSPLLRFGDVAFAASGRRAFRGAHHSLGGASRSCRRGRGGAHCGVWYPANCAVCGRGCLRAPSLAAPSPLPRAPRARGRGPPRTAAAIRALRGCRLACDSLCATWIVEHVVANWVQPFRHCFGDARCRGRGPVGK